jgi:hypothetical protein
MQPLSEQVYWKDVSPYSFKAILNQIENLSCYQASSFFNSRKDMIKTTNITPALIRKEAPPIELYKNPPKESPTILASPPKLPATPCTAP